MTNPIFDQTRNYQIYPGGAIYTQVRDTDGKWRDLLMVAPVLAETNPLNDLDKCQ